MGINYTGTANALQGCIEDAADMGALYAAILPPAKTTVQILTDPRGDAVPATDPTHANIVAGLEWSVGGMAPGDRAIVHYSGHLLQVN